MNILIYKANSWECSRERNKDNPPKRSFLCIFPPPTVKGLFDLVRLFFLSTVFDKTHVCKSNRKEYLGIFFAFFEFLAVFYLVPDESLFENGSFKNEVAISEGSPNIFDISTRNLLISLTLLKWAIALM